MTAEHVRVMQPELNTPPRVIDQITEILGGVSLAAATGGTGPKSMVDALAFERSGHVDTFSATSVDTELLASAELAQSDLTLSIGYSAARTASDLRAALNTASQPSYSGVYSQGRVR